MNYHDENDSISRASCVSSPSNSSRVTNPDSTLAKTLKTRNRNPLESLSSFVNSLEIKSMGSKISHSASSIRRSVSHRFADLPLFPAEETSDEFDEEHESTLNDDDWLASPTQKQKTAPRNTQDASAEIDLRQYTSNEHLPSTDIRTFAVAQDNLPRIDEHEMRRILEGEHAHSFDEYVVVDCRFPYEYEGGHISRAINVSSQQALEDAFLDEHITQECGGTRKLLIFHCEYSLLRGPTLAAHLRKADRHINAHRYPYLHYPDIVVLERGYKGFFDKFRHLCEPQAYVAMKDNNHRRTCEIEMGKVLQASKLTRAKSFNQFPPRLNLAHSRSASLTALLTNSEPSANTALPRSRRSLKIKKRDRRDSRPQFTQSLSSFSNAVESPQKESPLYPRFEADDFMPPTALFRNHSKSSCGSFVSVNSSSSSVCSESLSPTFSSSESLSEATSPFHDRPDFYKSGYDPIDTSALSTPFSNGLTTPTSSTFSHTSPNTFNQPSTPFSNQLPATQISSNYSIHDKTAGSKMARPILARPSPRPGLRSENSSPTFSSPLSLGTASALASRNGAISDPPVDSPVDYFLQPKSQQNSRRAGHSQFSDLGQLGE